MLMIANWRKILLISTLLFIVLCFVCDAMPVPSRTNDAVSMHQDWDMVPWIFLALSSITLIGWVYGNNHGEIPSGDESDLDDENEDSEDEFYEEDDELQEDNSWDEAHDNDDGSVVSDKPVRVQVKTEIHINDPYFLSTADLFDILIKVVEDDNCDRPIRFAAWSCMLDSSTHWRRRNSESKLDNFLLRESLRRLGMGKARSQSVAIEDLRPRYFNSRKWKRTGNYSFKVNVDSSKTADLPMPL